MLNENVIFSLDTAEKTN